MKESSVGGQSGGVVCNSPSPQRCCFVTGFRPDTYKLMIYHRCDLPASRCIYRALAWPPLVDVKADETDLYNWQNPTNCSFSALYQGNIAACFDSLFSPSEETAALAQHLQYFCLTLQDLKDKAVPWWMSEREVGIWSDTESLSSFLSLDTPFQLVNLDICLHFICLIDFRRYLTADILSSCRVDHWCGSHRAAPVGCSSAGFSFVGKQLLVRDIHGLPQPRLICSAWVFQGNRWIQESRGSWTGVSYTLVRAPVTEWFDNQNTPYGYVPTGLQI